RPLAQGPGLGGGGTADVIGGVLRGHGSQDPQGRWVKVEFSGVARLGQLAGQVVHADDHQGDGAGPADHVQPGELKGGCTVAGPLGLSSPGWTWSAGPAPSPW